MVRLTYEVESITDNDNSYGFEREFDKYWMDHKDDYKNDVNSNISRIYHITDRSLDDEIIDKQTKAIAEKKQSSLVTCHSYAVSGYIQTHIQQIHK